MTRAVCEWFHPPNPVGNMMLPAALLIGATVANNLLNGPRWLLVPILAVGLGIAHWRVKAEADHYAAGWER